jgi:hypothetical protein
MPSFGMICRVTVVVLTRATQRNILEDGILNSRRRENLKSYIVFMKLASTMRATYTQGK